MTGSKTIRIVILAVMALLGVLVTTAGRTAVTASDTSLPPGHDDISQARVVAAIPYQNRDDTSTATTSGSDPVFPCGSGNQGGKSVWYRYTPPATVDLVAHTHGSNYDTMLAVWTGSPGSLTNVACNDDSFSPGFSLRSEVKFRAQAGTLYYFEIASYNNGPAGNLVFSILENDRWWTRGPTQTAPSINELTIDPQNANVVYAATVQGVFKSVDGGSSWTPRLDGLGTFGGLEVTNLVVDPTNSQTLYISTWGDGVYKSTDGGNNWVLVEDPVALRRPAAETGERVRAGGLPSGAQLTPPTAVDKSLWDGTPPELSAALSISPQPPIEIDWTPARNIAIHPTNPSRLIVAVSNSWGHFITQDGGLSWSPLTMPGATLGSGRTAAFAPSNPNIAYASRGDWGSNGGIFRSTDGGLTWSLVPGNGTVTSVVTHFAIDPTNPNRVFASTSGQGVMMTVNGGQSWTSASTGMSDTTVFNIEISPVNTNFMIATGYVWIWRSTNGGASWSIADTSYPDFNTQALALHPTNNNIAYAGAQLTLLGDSYFGGGVYKTTNGGANFIPHTNGLGNTYVLDVENDPNDPNMVYTGLWGSGIYRSEDSGINWSQGNDGMTLPFVYTVEATQGVTGTVLYAGTFYSGAGLYASYDQGVSWSGLPTGSLPPLAQNVFDIESRDGGSNNLVIATGDGIHYSSNGGQTWSPGMLGGSPTQGIILDIEPVPGIAGRLLAATYGDGVYYSNNNGANWSMASGEPSTFVFGLSAAPGSSQQVYAATLGLAKSNNGGASWQPVSRGVPGSLFFRTVDHGLDGSGDVFAGSIGQGMWVAPDGTDVWFPFNNGFTPSRVRAVNAAFTHPLRIFVGTDGQSAWSFSPFLRPAYNASFVPLAVK